MSTVDCGITVKWFRRQLTRLTSAFDLVLPVTLVHGLAGGPWPHGHSHGVLGKWCQTTQEDLFGFFVLFCHIHLSQVSKRQCENESVPRH